MHTLWPWIVFIVSVLALLALDLGIVNRRPHPLSFREAAIWSAFWVALSLAFNFGIYWRYGASAALQFFTTYVLENSLSADNVFLFAVVFGAMGVAAKYQHRVLFWGVLGAVVMRGSFIIAGVQLVRRFHEVLYGFAVFLLFMGARLLHERGGKYDPTGSRVIRLARKLFPVSERYEGGHFFTRLDGRLCATPLLLVLIIIEAVDLTFALDSISAAFAVTQDAFIIFTSNILAILGLRSLYFLLARAMSQFRFLRTAVAALLMFMGATMLFARWVHVPTGFTLLGILLILGMAILLSLRSEGKLPRG
jgi:tellurite resistance protein TerC